MSYSVFLHNVTAAMLVSQTNPVGVEFLSYVNALDAGHVSENTLYQTGHAVFHPWNFPVDTSQIKISHTSSDVWIRGHWKGSLHNFSLPGLVE